MKEETRRKQNSSTQIHKRYYKRSDVCDKEDEEQCV